MPSSALGQVVEAGPQCGETSAELPYVFRILRPANVPIISARLTGVNRRAIYGQYGTVGFALVDVSRTLLTDMMFSCRIQFKRVDHAVLCFLLQTYKRREFPWFDATYRKTDQNQQVGQVFDDMGFAEVEQDGSHFRYRFKLSEEIPDDHIINVFWNGQEWAP